MLERLKLRIILWFFYVLGAIHRRLFPDPLADFFTEMEKSRRLDVKQHEVSSEAEQSLSASRRGYPDP
jgi:hypothetical protein